jgi:hypothetical protein
VCSSGGSVLRPRYGERIKLPEGESQAREDQVITARDGLGRITPVADQGSGQFIAELGTLADDPTSLADCRAEGDVEALLIPPEKIRTLIVEEADLGERIMRALVLHRVALIEFEAGGPLVIGAAASRDVVRLVDFLPRPAGRAQSHRHSSHANALGGEHGAGACPPGVPASLTGKNEGP